jgi:hypothetical protein
MKIKRIVVLRLLRRFIAVLCFSFGVIVWYWQTPPDPVPTSFLVQLPSPPETIIQSRNLSEYDYGGIIPSCFNNFEISVKECEATEKRARDFILKHWQNKKRAYIIVQYGGTDVSGEKHVFIEPNNSGQWEIVRREDAGASNFVMRGFGSNIIVETARFIKTKRATNKNDDYPHKLGTSYLIFFDKDGKEIISF